MTTTPANEHEITQADKLLRGQEQTAWADVGYPGLGKRAQLPASSSATKLEELKASVRAKVEHPFGLIKRVFGYSKVRYRGIYKNTERLHLLAGLANLMTAEKYLGH